MAYENKVGARFFVPLYFVVAALSASALTRGPAALLAEEPIAPVLATGPSNPAKITLGERLFNDARLSHNDVISCNSCHRLDLSGDDGQARSVAADGELLDFNAPTVFNAAFNFRLNWRGNFQTFEDQNEAALTDHRLMNTSWEELLPKLRSDPNYAEQFAEVYNAGANRTNVLDALAAFQRSLITPNARFDRYLTGEPGAITAEEKQGYQLFKAYGCVACHQGANVGGNLFQKFGIFQDPFADEKTLSLADQGRFALTHIERDRHVFRVPSLRNVAVTSPYFHDGRTSSLADAVKIMARNQVGRDLDQRHADLIVEFLGTLTGEFRGRPLKSAADRPKQ